MFANSINADFISSRSLYVSRCSLSNVVNAAITGVSFKNVLSNSSASTTINSPFPNRALVPPSPLNFPPTIIVGSIPPSVKHKPTILVVVVLPCVPAIPIPYFILIVSASISDRLITGMFFSMAAATSGLSVVTADE